MLTRVLLLAFALAAQGTELRDALRIGRTSDEALYASFTRGYDLSPAQPVASAEVVTEFRRAVMLVRERARLGDLSVTEYDLGVALKPFAGTVTIVAQVNLRPLNTFTRPPLYDLYISTGRDTPPVAASNVRREAVFPMGAAAGSMMAVRIEATFPRDRIIAAAAPELVVTDDGAELLWRGRLDLSRFR
jgi:hypothetical protein